MSALRRPRTALVAALALAALAPACATVDHSRPVVSHLRIHGAHAVSAGDVRAHIATRETPRLPLIGVRDPFNAPTYYEPATFNRDQQRVVRYYETRGYYQAQVSAANVATTDNGHAVNLDLTVREGPATHVEELHVVGCDPPAEVSADAPAEATSAGSEQAPGAGGDATTGAGGGSTSTTNTTATATASERATATASEPATATATTTAAATTTTTTTTTTATTPVTTATTESAGTTTGASGATTSATTGTNGAVVGTTGSPTTVTTTTPSAAARAPTEPEVPVPPRVCERARSLLHLHRGDVFTEEAFHADEQLLLDLLKDEGHALATVQPHATVVPERHLARVAFVLHPGPVARFGEVTLVEGANDRPAQNGILPRSGYPVGPALNAVNIQSGSRYNRSAVAAAQRALFALGVFGIVRVEEVPHRCDSRGRCDAARDTSDTVQTGRVDLRIHVGAPRHFHLRLGLGAEANQLRSDVHLLVSSEVRNFLGGMRRLRLEDRPLVFFPSIFGGNGPQQFDLGNALSTELLQPGIWRGGNGVASASWDFGPDPYNPGLTDRSRVSGAVGAQHTFDRELRGAAYARVTLVDYYQSPITGGNSLIDADPIFLSQYRPSQQAYAYFEQQLTWDRRDSPIATRRGTYFTALTQEGVPAFGMYAFLRAAVEGRGYVPLGGGFVLAARGYVGAVFGLGDDVNGWPVPQELRFYSGGANSNRGYAFNRVGPLVVAPGINCTGPDGATIPYYDARCRGGGGTAPYSLYVQDHNAVADTRRAVSVGGLSVWEASVEMRWYTGPFGLVLFLDASDIGGWTPPSFNSNNPNDPGNLALRRPDPIANVSAVASRTPTLPGAQSLVFGFDPHLSSGIGVRYVTPVGVVRLDLGLRLDDLGCTAFPDAVRAQNAATLGQPWYYVAPRPQCDFFNLPLALNFALGEAY